jgi:hypothetical protein
MNRYRAYGNLDDQPQVVGDNSFIGVDEYNAPENIKPGNVQKAVNHDFTSQDAVTRGGFVCLPELATEAFGSKWNTALNTTSGDARCITFGANLFVAGGILTTGYPCVITSLDAITWTQTAIPGAALGQIARIAFANGAFVAGSTSNNQIYFSSNGTTWSISASTIPSGSLSPKGLAYGNGKWIGVYSSISGSTFTPITSSDNGVTWTTGTVQTAFGGATDLFFYNGVFILTTLFGKVVTSVDGITWTLGADLDALFTFGTIAGITFGNNAFCAISTGGGIAISGDLTNWTLVQAAYTSNYIFSDIDFFNGRFIAIGREDFGATKTTVVLTSIYGTNWILYDTDIAEADFFPADQSLANGNNTSVVINSSNSGTYDAIYSYSAPLQNIYASSIYSDPNNIGQTWIMMLGNASVGFFANGYTGKSISLGSYQVTTQSTIVQANNYVYIFRGPDETPLYWDGNWNGTFELVPDTTLPASFLSIPKSNQATFCQNRLWVIDGKDEVAASDVLAFTDYDPLANELHINTGGSDYLVATFPFGQDSLIAFKNKSILLIQNIQGALSNSITGVPIATVTEITRQVGLVGINGVTSIGPDLAYVSNQNINLLTLTSTNNSLQHKTLPLSTRIRTIMSRVNWKVGYKISIGYWSNKLYVALPVDNSLVCNAVVVYNFTTENWFGEWSFDSTLNMCIQSWQVIDYLGLQRMHAVTEDGRIFVTDEGQNDISGATVAEISTQLVTRAYDTSNVNHFQRRAFVDLATNRPEVSVSAFTEGASEESVILTDQTYSRSETWKFADSAYDLTNANNDFNRAYRKDYSTGSLGDATTTPGSPATGLQTGTGFQPQMVQEYRLPLITRRQGRLSWLEVTNTQGYINVMAVGYEARAGQRANLVQV